jgi:hypothetical protein
MKLTSVFRHPEGGVAAGIGTGIAVFLIYQASLPPLADVRMAQPPNEPNLEATRKSAAMKSAALIGLVFLVTRDLNTFIISGASLGGIDYLYKHHNAINPNTGKFEAAPDTMSPQLASVHPMPEYGYESEAMG